VRRIRARLSAAWLLAGVFALPVPASIAQTRATLPGSVVEAASIGGAERSQIDAFVAALAPAASGAESEEATRARKELVAPLTGTRPSVAFRQAYAQSAASLLAGMIGSNEPGARLAGLRLAGHLGTGDTVSMIRQALTDSDAGVRLFAAVQAGRVFEVTNAAGPALTESQAAQLIDALKASANADSGAKHAQTVIRALGSAAQMRLRELPGTRSHALAALSAVATDRARGIKPAELLASEETLLLATSIATRSVSEAGTTVSDAAAKAAAELGGQILAITLTRQTQNMMGSDLEADIRLLNAGESLIYFARRRQVENARGNPNSVPQTKLAELLLAQDRGFRNELVRLIGPGSDFLRQFGLPNDRFVK
jgi:hypothetical protein